MALYKHGNLWDNPKEDSVFVVTANSVINSNGELIMGAGAAKSMKLKFPTAPKLFGFLVTPMGRYGYLEITIEDYYLGILQTKYHYREQSTLKLVGYSLSSLNKKAVSNNNLLFHCNFPGIGLGKLHTEVVLPLTNECPDNVIFYTL